MDDFVENFGLSVSFNQIIGHMRLKLKRPAGIDSKMENELHFLDMRIRKKGRNMQDKQEMKIYETKLSRIYIITSIEFYNLQ